MSAPLEGIRILELANFIQPLTGCMLGDLGAEVIKIEKMPSGDYGRGVEIVETSRELPFNPFFEVFNRNKQSISINLDTTHGREVIYRLVMEADVFITNVRVSACSRLGIDYSSLVKHNPRIIYCHTSGRGSKGPDSEKPATDHAIQARGGLMSLIGETGKPPGRMPAGVADVNAAVLAAFGIMVALYKRQQTGTGQEVKTSLLAGQILLGSHYLQTYLTLGEMRTRINRDSAPNPLMNIYKTRDDRWLSLSMDQSDRYWPTFCLAMDIGILETDQRFNSRQGRKENARYLVKLLDDRFVTRTSSEWVEILGKYDLMADLVCNYADLATDPQVLENEYITTFDHPNIGPSRVVGLPVEFTDTPGSLKKPAPELGQHTEEVLLNVGGYSWNEIVELRSQGAIL